MLALGLADISLNQPMLGFGLVVLVAFSRFYLGERITRPVAIGVAAVVVDVAEIGMDAELSRELTSSRSPAAG